MSNIVKTILFFAVVVAVAMAAICNNERGPKLCNRHLLTQISNVCNGLGNAELLTSDETLPRCCCSFGCSDTYLRRTVCPNQII